MITKIVRRLRNREGRQSLVNHLTSFIRGANYRLSKFETSSLQEFWNKAHKIKSHYWLSGTPPEEVFSRFRINENDLRVQGSFLLDVGVGEGLMARHLSKLGINFDALDISIKALQQISRFAKETFTDASQLPSKKYTLVMHHLVAQHMSNIELTTQLRYLVNSLRPSGRISMQIMTPMNSKNWKSNDSMENQKLGLVKRSKSEIIEIIEKCNGKLSIFEKLETFPDIESEWYFVEILPKD